MATRVAEQQGEKSVAAAAVEREREEKIFDILVDFSLG